MRSLKDQASRKRDAPWTNAHIASSCQCLQRCVRPCERLLRASINLVVANRARLLRLSQVATSLRRRFIFKMRNSHSRRGPNHQILYRFAKNFAGRHGPRCAIPGCPNRGAKQQCCKQPLCVACLAHTLRTEFDDRLRTRCPYCRKTLLRPPSASKKLMRAFPSHAATIECEGGPPVVLAHLPCPHGHYECRTSTVRLLSIAQKQMLSSTQARLDLAEKKNVQLTQTLSAMRGCHNARYECGKRGGGVLSPERKGNDGIDSARILEEAP